jgi:hypothetical protein
MEVVERRGSVTAGEMEREAGVKKILPTNNIKVKNMILYNFKWKVVENAVTLKNVMQNVK